jgi:anti-sigma B factor antagonist
VKITHRVVNTLTILRVRGVLAADPDATELETFRTAVEEATADAVDLAIDVSEVPTIDSEGVGELARALGRMTRRGGRLALIAPSPQVRKVLMVTKLDDVFHVLDSEGAAIDLLARGTPPEVTRSFVPN